MPFDRKKTEALLDDCEEHESRLNDWERSFVASIREQVGNGLTLYDTQIEKLEQIWSKATQPRQ